MVIRRVKALDDDLPIIVVSGHASLENAVRAVKAGAFDFLAKPFSPESVGLMLAKLARERDLRRAVRSGDADLAALRGESPAMTRLREWILRVREVRANVLIEGESGTGKELVARVLHAGRGPFVALNVAALPDALAEAELFGVRRGAYTGADRDRPGLIREAHGGVLFLDEVNAMSAPVQAKLLRVHAPRGRRAPRATCARRRSGTARRRISQAVAELETLQAFPLEERGGRLRPGTRTLPAGSTTAIRS